MWSLPREQVGTEACLNMVTAHQVYCKERERKVRCICNFANAQLCDAARNLDVVALAVSRSTRSTSCWRSAASRWLLSVRTSESWRRPPWSAFARRWRSRRCRRAALRSPSRRRLWLRSPPLNEAPVRARILQHLIASSPLTHLVLLCRTDVHARCRRRPERPCANAQALGAPRNER